MFLRRQYPWAIEVSTFQLNIVRKLLLDQELTEAEDIEARRMGQTLDENYNKLATHRDRDDDAGVEDRIGLERASQHHDRVNAMARVERGIRRESRPHHPR